MFFFSAVSLLETLMPGKGFPIFLFSHAVCLFVTSVHSLDSKVITLSNLKFQQFFPFFTLCNNPHQGVKFSYFYINGLVYYQCQKQYYTYLP